MRLQAGPFGQLRESSATRMDAVGWEQARSPLLTKDVSLSMKPTGPSKRHSRTVRRQAQASHGLRSLDTRDHVGLVHSGPQGHEHHVLVL